MKQEYHNNSVQLEEFFVITEDIWHDYSAAESIGPELRGEFEMEPEMITRTVNQIAIFSVPVILIIVMIVTRSKYKNKSNAGAFFIEDNNLVLNTGIPYPIPFDQIDFVELKYNSWQLEHQLSYGLSVKVVKKDGKTKRVFYTGYKTAKLALPSDMEAALQENGIRCVMVDTQR